jgi:hypothetical protein
MERAEKDGETDAEFADRVQAATAEHLGLVASRWGNREKNKFFSRDVEAFVESGFAREHWLPPG